MRTMPGCPLCNSSTTAACPGLGTTTLELHRKHPSSTLSSGLRQTYGCRASSSNLVGRPLCMNHRTHASVGSFSIHCWICVADTGEFVAKNSCSCNTSPGIGMWTFLAMAAGRGHPHSAVSSLVSLLQSVKHLIQVPEMLLVIFPSDQDVIQVGGYMWDVLQQAVHCPLEYCWG